MKKWYLGESLGILKGSSCVSVGLVWTSSMVSFSTSSFCNITHKWALFTSSHAQPIPLKEHPRIFHWFILVLLFMGYAFCCVIRFPLPSHQLYVVDASLFELLQSSFGLFLQWECEALESLRALVQAELHGDLRDRRIKGMGKPGRAYIRKANKKLKIRPAPAPSESRSVYAPPEDTRERSETRVQRTRTALTVKGTYPHNFVLQEAEKDTLISWMTHSDLPDRFDPGLPLSLWSAAVLARLLRAGPGTSRTRCVAGIPEGRGRPARRGRSERKPLGRTSGTRRQRTWPTSAVPKSSSLMWPPPNSFFRVARVAAYTILCLT